MWLKINTELQRLPKEIQSQQKQTMLREIDYLIKDLISLEIMPIIEQKYDEAVASGENLLLHDFIFFPDGKRFTDVFHNGALRHELLKPDFK